MYHIVPLFTVVKSRDNKEAFLIWTVFIPARSVSAGP